METNDQVADRHILSYGGGVNSVALLVLLLREKYPLDGVVFADTGGELPETYAYLEIAKDFLAQRDDSIPFTVVAKRGATLYETAWRRQVFPSAIWRWSTRDFKINPIMRHYRSLGGHVNQYLAIAWNEVERMRDSRFDYVTNIYPLVDRRMTREDCVEVIRKAGLPIPPKSACFFCPFGTIDRWRWIYDTHPDLYDKAMTL
ncbi:MAG TPA: phosphoadenosine phosphosulfate reductase family protein, partial [Chloroflexota bacterium]|nr:phosphoadenosine phosphosulfate reductase family protein [Chloroflexota bacterium]